jgi:sugar phosphate isomerase/epimerase
MANPLAETVEDRIGVSTHFLPATHGEDIHDAARMVAEAGFRGFEIVPSLDHAQIGYPENHPNVGIDLLEATDADLERLKESLAAFDWGTVHAPHLDWNQASANRHLRRLTWDYYDRCLEFAAAIGAVACTYHTGGQTPGYQRSLDTVWEFSIDYALHVAPRARELGVAVGYETGWDLRWLQDACDRVEGWGVNLDIGHSYMRAFTDEGFLEHIHVLGDRIVEVHHNGVNHFFGRFMEHQPPHMNNMIDFQGTYEALRDAGFAGPIVCEVQGNDVAQVIRHCLESKEMIVGIWRGTRPLRERWNVPQ